MILLTDSNAVERIATAYKNYGDDDVDYIRESDLWNMRELINMQFGELSKNLHFDFVDGEPYSYNQISELMPDWRSRVVRVNTTGNDSKLWGKFYNLQFRAIHDYIHCIKNLDFNYKAEVKAFHAQYEYSLLGKFAEKFPQMNWDLYKKVLRSEIVYQAAVKEYFGEFHIDQKIILSEL